MIEVHSVTRNEGTLTFVTVGELSAKPGDHVQVAALGRSLHLHITSSSGDGRLG